MAINIVFMGSPNLAANVLKTLVSQYEVKGVITQPDRPAGRGKVLTPPPVKILAEELSIPCLQPERLKRPESFAELEALKPDLIIVAAFGQILRQNVLDLPKYGCINVHASYLPRWRGAAPIQAAILNGDEFTGISIMKMDAGIDTGPVLMQERVDILPDETLNSLTDKLADIGGKTLLKALPLYLNGTLKPVSQTDENATYAPMLNKENGKLDFSTSVQILERKVRAFNDWPGTFLEFDGQLLKVRKVKKVLTDPHPYGIRKVEHNLPAISTPDGLLLLEEVQPAGKKWMSGSDFLRGTRNWITGN